MLLSLLFNKVAHKMFITVVRIERRDERYRPRVALVKRKVSFSAKRYMFHSIRVDVHRGAHSISLQESDDKRIPLVKFGYVKTMEILLVCLGPIQFPVCNHFPDELMIPNGNRKKWESISQSSRSNQLKSDDATATLLPFWVISRWEGGRFWIPLLKQREWASEVAMPVLLKPVLA